MRASITLLLIIYGTISYAADKLPLSDFMNDIRQQLFSIEQAGNNAPSPMIIKNIHVEMNVIAEKDPQGKTIFYVIEGMANKKDLITQKLSFDVEIPMQVSADFDHSKRRTYSTRSRLNQYDADRYRPYRRHPEPYYNGRYYPDISPVILFNKEH